MFPDKQGASNREVSILGKVAGEEIAGDAIGFLSPSIRFQMKDI